MQNEPLTISPGTYGGTATAIAWSPNGKYLAVIDGDNTTIWDAAQRTKVFTEEKSGVMRGSISWAPDSDRIASTGLGPVTRVWSLSQRGKTLYTISDSPSVVKWSPAGRFLLANNNILNPQDGSVLQTISDMYTNFLENDHVSLCEDSVAYFPTYKTVSLWDTGTGSSRSLYSDTSLLNSLGFSPDCRYVAIGGGVQGSSKIVIVDARTGNVVRTMMSAAYATVWSPDGKYIASSNFWGDRFTIWDASTGKEIKTEIIKFPRDISWCPNSKLVAVAFSVSVQSFSIL